MRVIHLIPYFYPAWAYGGIPRIASGLCRGLARRGIETLVFTTDSLGAERAGSEREEWEGIPVRRARNLSNRLAYRHQFFTPLGFRRILREKIAGSDLAHIHGCHHLPGVLAGAELRRSGIPYLVSPYGTAPRLEQHLIGKWVFDRLFWDRVFFASRHYHAISEFEARQLAGLGIPRERITMVYPGLNVEEFADLPPRGGFRARLGIGGSRKLVLFLGRISARKGIDHLVRAWARVARTDAVLVIAGNDCGYRAALARLARREKVRDRVVFTGLLEGKERGEAYADADLLAYPSTLEAFGLVPGEALLCGVPVIITREAGCAEVLRHLPGSVTEVEYGDVKGIARAIELGLQAGFHPGAAAELRRRLDWDLLAGQMAGVYERILSGEGKP